MTAVIQRAFSSGEVSPSYYHRVDFYAYQTGCRTVRNTIVKSDGGLWNRPGSKFVGYTKQTGLFPTMIPFVYGFSLAGGYSGAYVLEFLDGIMRVHKDGEQIREANKTITGITQANPGVVTSTSHGYNNGDEVYISGVVGMTQINSRTFLVKNKTAHTFEITDVHGNNINTTGFTAYASGGVSAKTFELVTPFTSGLQTLLNYNQAHDVMTLTNKLGLHEPYELIHTSATSWVIQAKTIGPTQAPPTSVARDSGGDASGTSVYRISAVSKETGEESVAAQNGSAISFFPTSAAPLLIDWVAAADADRYNVYRQITGPDASYEYDFGFVGSVPGTSLVFKDRGFPIDYTKGPQFSRDPFSSTDNYPVCSGYYQQRLLYGGSINKPERVWSSQTGAFNNFNISSPIRDSDAVTFDIVGNGKQLNQVLNIIDIGALVVMTADGEWVVQGNEAGILTPGGINLRQHTYNGSFWFVQPVVMDNTALYVQRNGRIIRDLVFNLSSDGYAGNDITVTAKHLFRKNMIINLTLQKQPTPIVWVQRSDGESSAADTTLLGCTYARENNITAWHRHDSNGAYFMSVCAVPDVEDITIDAAFGTGEDKLYMAVIREIDGVETRMIERLDRRYHSNVRDYKLMDSHLSFYATTFTGTLSGGTDWLETETLTLTSATTFPATLIGEQIHMFDADGNILKMMVTAAAGGTTCSVMPIRTVPVNMRNVLLTCTFPADTLGGLWHLEGENVSIFGDGKVLASPNNASYDIVTVTNGQVNLEDWYSVVHVGIPYISDVETLDIDSVSSETVANKKKIISNVAMHVEDTRGLWVGDKPPEDDETDPLQGLQELKLRDEEAYQDPVALITDVIEEVIQGHWNSDGRVFIRQVDPLPFTINSIIPEGEIPFKRLT